MVINEISCNVFSHRLAKLFLKSNIDVIVLKCIFNKIKDSNYFVGGACL